MPTGHTMNGTLESLCDPVLDDEAVFMFTSESVGEGHPGKDSILHGGGERLHPRLCASGAGSFFNSRFLSASPSLFPTSALYGMGIGAAPQMQAQ